MLSYDFPLNEKVRTFLRVEDLFAKVEYFTAQNERLAHHAAMLTLLEILEVTSRADLKADLLQELERSRLQLDLLHDNPSIDQAALACVQEEIAEVLQRLRGVSGKPGQHLRDNEWLMAIKQRNAIPGGLCEFDVPSYHFWLNQAPAQRREEIRAWVRPLAPTREGVTILLRLLRDSGHSSQHLAERGAWQQMLNGRTAQLLRITLSERLQCYPEVSANRYAINIRFLPVAQPLRGRNTETDVEFDLMLCSM